MPQLLQLALVVAVALSLGSFSTVLGTRVVAGEGLLGRSQCRSCSAQISATDNIPILGWLRLRGKCRHCSHAIGFWYLFVELLSTPLALFVLTREISLPLKAAWSLFLLFGLALIVSDMAARRLPNLLVGLLSVFLWWVLLFDALESRSGLPLRAMVLAAALCGFYMTIRLLSKGGMGLGDVKLAVPIGFITGYMGLIPFLMAFIASSLLGGLYAFALLVLKRADRKTVVPFGPFMILGAFAALL